MRQSWLTIFFSVVGLSLALEPEYVTPEQIHLSLGSDVTKMCVTWVTMKPTNSSSVMYGDGGPQRRQEGTQTTFTNGGPEQRVVYVHRAVMIDLAPDTEYSYYCGSSTGWSNKFTFRTLKYGTDWSPRFAVYGDMGTTNAQSLPYITQDVHNNMYDVILHVGDFGYDMPDDNGRVGDQFLRQAQAVAAHLPYMTVPGNHESAYNFSHYINKFTMQDSIINWYYSFDVGPVHIIGFDSEVYFFGDLVQVKNQYAWLQKDLTAANLNRAKTPWVIAMGHRRLYCSNWGSDDCAKFESTLRLGPRVGFDRRYGLEDLFFNNGVDVVLQAHEHSYERMYPLYDRVIYPGPMGMYVEPCAPVHIISGAAGCKERTDIFQPHPPPWSAYRSADYGYGRMTVHNNTHLYWEQISIDWSGKVIDSMWLVKHRHGPYDILKCTPQPEQRVENLPREKVNITAYFRQ